MLEKPQTANNEREAEAPVIPTQEILHAFNVSGIPNLLSGGQGTSYRVDNVVLKPTRDIVEPSWLAEIQNGLSSNKFRVPKPSRAKNGSWVFNGWTASEFLEGEHRPGHYAEAIELSRSFHRALKGIPKPGWFDKKTDVFAISDKMAWGETSLPDYDHAKEPLQRIFNLLKENRLPNQLIHGDWGTGQILFHDTLPPAVLDMTPYFRPADYPIADMIVAALDHEDADTSIIDLGINVKDFDQLLLRALVFRTCTYIGFQIHPENDRDWVPTIDRHLDLIDPIVSKLAAIHG